MAANLTATTTISTTYAGTDQNGATVNMTVTAPAVVNTGALQAMTFAATVSGNGVISILFPGGSGGGYQMCTVTPPSTNTAAINLGTASTGIPINPALPFAFPIISGATGFSLFIGGFVSPFSLTITLG